MDKVLDTVRMVAGGDFIDPHFNPELIMHANTVIAFLSQIGVEFTTRRISEDTTWEELIPDIEMIEDVRTFLSYKTKLIFDPPAGSSALSALQATIDECEWRIREAVD